ncbi:histidine triad (HIT) family protein [Halomicrobium zhouii]|uniref:Histidine triad (HIT) family protein n=1 Tax=Halomicrobium zhouii TaxID=767519 RepID=A0A1I6K660_9EURY|nr:HIT domain-containing protein [Halomicrobium zhouii]SFR86731.1 histidine triad (HIT) family protein [Halomicrobium zhouii]
MDSDCIFCQIVAGDIPANVVAETDDAIAFLDANPLAPGHTLVIPKEHYHRLNDVPDDVAAEVLGLVHEVVPAVEAAVDAPATTVAFNNGEEAGQEVPHVHGHIVPRSGDDGQRPIHALFEDRPGVGDEEMNEIAAAIQAER